MKKLRKRSKPKISLADLMKIGDQAMQEVADQMVKDKMEKPKSQAQSQANGCGLMLLSDEDIEAAMRYGREHLPRDPKSP